MKPLLCGALVALLGATPIAGAAAPQGEAAFLRILSTHNTAYAAAKTPARRQRIRRSLTRSLCRVLPHLRIRDWVGSIAATHRTHNPPGMRIVVNLAGRHIVAGALGHGLSLGNFYAYGLGPSLTLPTQSIVIEPGSAAYAAVSQPSGSGGTKIVFSARIVPFTSLAACQEALRLSTYVAAVRFTSIRPDGTAH